MNSTTVISVAGIAGTLLASISGTWATVRTAQRAGERQDRAEVRQARRQAYATLATALVVCMGSVRERMEALISSVDEDPIYDRTRLAEKAGRLAEPVESQLQAVTDALGAVMIEGPDMVAGIGSEAVEHLRAWAERLDNWLDAEDPQRMIVHQARFGRDDQADTELMVDRFSKACRDLIHPDDSSRHPYGRGRRVLPWG